MKASGDPCLGPQASWLKTGPMSLAFPQIAASRKTCRPCAKCEVTRSLSGSVSGPPSPEKYQARTESLKGVCTVPRGAGSVIRHASQCLQLEPGIRVKPEMLTAWNLTESVLCNLRISLCEDRCSDLPPPFGVLLRLRSAHIAPEGHPLRCHVLRGCRTLGVSGVRGFHQDSPRVRWLRNPRSTALGARRRRHRQRRSAQSRLDLLSGFTGHPRRDAWRL